MAAALLATAGPAAAGEPQPFGVLECERDGDIRVCEDREAKIPSFDGTPLDVRVLLPGKITSTPPLVSLLGGYPGGLLPIDSEYILPSPRSFAERGYAVLTSAPRGTFGSCGPDALATNPMGCARGYFRVADSRYEVRDVQHLIGLLADEGLAHPRHIGVIGESYGAGQALQLAVLRNRVRLPDGSYARWESPQGLSLRIAGVAALNTWSDLAYALAPNGGTLDSLDDDMLRRRSPVGVLKATFLSGLIAVGAPYVYEPPPGVDPDSNLIGWYTALLAGEPYSNPVAVDFVDELSSNHSALGLEFDRPPAPAFLGNGFTDDLFPVDEALRYANHVTHAFPGAAMSQLYGDFGHQRAQNKPADRALLRRRTISWIDHYAAGRDVRAYEGVEALRQTCPFDAPSGRSVKAATWAALSPGVIRARAAEAQTVTAPAPDDGTGMAVDPIISPNPCAITDADDEIGAATYRVHAREPISLIGSPTIVAKLAVAGAEPADAQVAARLWDVMPSGADQRLVARGVYRPRATGRDIFQLHANRYRFGRDHTLKLEMLGSDPPYLRPSNASYQVTVSDLALRLPVRQRGRVRTAFSGD